MREGYADYVIWLWQVGVVRCCHPLVLVVDPPLCGRIYAPRRLISGLLSIALVTI